MHMGENGCGTPLPWGVDLGVLHGESAQSNTIFGFPIVELLYLNIFGCIVYPCPQIYTIRLEMRQKRASRFHV